MASYVWEVRILEGRDILSRDIKAVALEVTAGRVNKKLGPFYGAPSPRFDQVVPLRFTAEEYRTLEVPNGAGRVSCAAFASATVPKQCTMLSADRQLASAAAEDGNQSMQGHGPRSV